MKVALVHDWLTGMRGGEKCLEVFCELFPEADILTLLHIPGSVSPTIERHRIVPSFLQRLPGSRRWYRHYLPLMPTAVETLDLSAYDLVLSSSHCAAKGVIPRPDALHVSYVYTPMRYAWDLWPQYFPPTGWVSRAVLPVMLNYLRLWDTASAHRVDQFVAISEFVARRIAKYYRREASVIYPPVDTSFFVPGGESDDHYLMVAALVPYKGVDLAIQAFNALRRPLKIVGSGPLEKPLRRLAGPTVELLGWRSDAELQQYYAACRAVIFPSQEDFGIVPLEANASGRPVIALGQGGALETVTPANDLQEPLAMHPDIGPHHVPTGVLFPHRTPESLVAAVRFFEAHDTLFSRDALRQHALPFDRKRFKDHMRQMLATAWAVHQGEATPSPVGSAGDKRPHA